jgi:hypothetical protein
VEDIKLQLAAKRQELLNVRTYLTALKLYLQILQVKDDFTELVTSLRSVQGMYIEDVKNLTTLLSQLASQEHAANSQLKTPRVQEILEHASQTLKTLDNFEQSKQ